MGTPEPSAYGGLWFLGGNGRSSGLFFTRCCRVQRWKGGWAAAEDVPSVLCAGGDARVPSGLPQGICSVDRSGAEGQGPTVNLTAGSVSTVYLAAF